MFGGAKIFYAEVESQRLEKSFCDRREFCHPGKNGGCFLMMKL